MKFKNTILLFLLISIASFFTACTNEKMNSSVTSERNELLNPNSNLDHTTYSNTDKNEDITDFISENISTTNSVTPTPIQGDDFKLGHQKSNTIIYIDLDSDEKAEKIEYKASGRLFINDIEHDDHLVKFVKDKPLTDYYTILDIDTNDKYLEIGISTYGRSDDLYTLFYYYNKGELTYMGCVEGIPYFDGEESITVAENGVLKTSKELNLLHSFWLGDEYIDLNETHQLIVRKQDFYETRNFSQVKLRQPLMLYSKPDKNSDSFAIKDQSVTFLMTDNKNWVKLKSEDGTEGWFFVVEYRYMEDGKTLASDIFEGLEYWD